MINHFFLIHNNLIHIFGYNFNNINYLNRITFIIQKLLFCVGGRGVTRLATSYPNFFEPTWLSFGQKRFSNTTIYCYFRKLQSKLKTYTRTAAESKVTKKNIIGTSEKKKWNELKILNHNR